MLTKDSFTCTCCGACCMDVTVKLKDSDIHRLEKAGHQKHLFAEADVFDPSTGSHALKQQENGWCVFLRKEAHLYTCSVWEHRPEVCRKYPFFDEKPIKSCLPEATIISRIGKDG